MVVIVIVMVVGVADMGADLGMAGGSSWAWGS
jgi:hypothetical protein